jgi:glycosyltransferase involved in cell wall biosynthesis
MPKYKHLNWISMSYAQREGMPPDTNWIGNIYHGMSDPAFKPADTPSRDYFAYMGRIIEPKGVHLAIQAVKRYNKTAEKPLPLRIVGKHYAEESKDRYWQEKIVPHIDGKEIIYDGFINTSDEKAKFLANAKALLVPSLFDEPFGMVSIEAFACDTPVVTLNSGALPELIDDGVTGFVVEKQYKWNGKLDEALAASKLADALHKIDTVKTKVCRNNYEAQFTRERMAADHKGIYSNFIN